MKTEPNAMEVARTLEPEVLTYTVPFAGAMVGLPPSGSYAAAKRGEIPTMRFGHLLRVPKAKWDRMVLGE
jgi:hypothetical protein